MYLLSVLIIYRYCWFAIESSEVTFIVAALKGQTGTLRITQHSSIGTASGFISDRVHTTERVSKRVNKSSPVDNKQPHNKTNKQTKKYLV